MKIMIVSLLVGTAAASAQVPGPEVRVALIHGVPTFTVDGEPLTIPCFETYVPEQKYFEQFAEAGVKLFTFNTNSAQCDYGHSKPTWLSADVWDYSGFEERAQRVINAKPDALILPRINLGTPLWWLDANPEEMEILDHGDALYREPNTNPTLPKNRPFPSVVSAKWRADMGMALRRFIDHVQQTKFAPNIFGYMLTGLDTEEWYPWSSGSNQLLGYSTHMKMAFQAWLRAKYKTDAALAQAWNRAGLRFEDVAVPAREERWDRESVNTLRDLREKMNVIDFYRFYNEIIPDTIRHFADIARDATQGRKAIGAFYGYMYEFRGDPEYGHNALEKFNAIDSLDFIFVTASYNGRTLGFGGDYSRSPAYSVRLHNKLWYHDNDVCSFLAPKVLKAAGMNEDGDWSTSLLHHLDVLGYTDTPEKSRWMYRRSMGFALCSGAYESYFDLHGGYYDDPALMQEVALLNRIGDNSKNRDRSSVAEILIVSDEASCDYFTFSNPMLEDTLLDTQFQLIKIGAPADHVLLCDLDKLDTARYKLTVFLNCCHMTDKQRATVRERLLNNGRMVIWAYATGYFNGNMASLDDAEQLTGIRIEPEAAPELKSPAIKLLRVADAFTQPLYNDYVGPIGPQTATCRLFHVKDPRAVALGVTPGTENIALAQRDMGDWKSIYTITPTLPAAFYRAAARAAGVHIYNGNNDTFYANASYVSLHANGAGPRVLRFPRPVKVLDEVSGDILLERGTLLERHFQNGETVIFQYE